MNTASTSKGKNVSRNSLVRHLLGKGCLSATYPVILALTILTVYEDSAEQTQHTYG